MKRTWLVLWALLQTAAVPLIGRCIDRPPADSAAVDPAQKACFRCHADKGLFGFDVRGRRKSVYVDPLSYRTSAHGSLSCTDCHQDISVYQLPHARHAEKVTCLTCHHERRLPKAPAFKEEIIKSYVDSIHGKAVAKGDPDAPSCPDCHGHHNILPAEDTRSQVHRHRIATTCSRCHSDADLVEWHQIPKGETLYYYERSVHGQLLRKGAKGGKSAPGKEPAVCTDCHGIHGIKKADDPHATVARPHLPETCGKCHETIEKEWREGIHGQGWQKGIKEAPVCTDCHGEHAIRSPEDPESQVHPQHIVATCSKCHENEAIQRQIGLPTERLETYRTSYHGIMNRYGVSEVAHCGSCHGAHKILPSTDPRSAIHPANLATTCGHCHPGIGSGVTMGKVHFTGTRTAAPAYWFVKVAYQILIFVLIGFFSVYVGLDLISYARRKPSHAIVASHGSESEWVERLTLNERLQHLVLALSFFILVISGMPLSYPEAGWAERILSFPGSAEVRGWIHRFGAVLLMLLIPWHGIYLMTPRGREQLRHLIWRRKDFADILQMIRVYLGLSNEKPQFHRFSWIEKLEYYAVLWGTFVMVLTGLALWFEEAAFHLLPLWFWHICRLVHSYEALLAFLAIIIWHLYHVHFKPGVFPMNPAWLTGKVPLEHWKEEHYLEYLEEQEKRKAQERPPYD
ncbi:MAG: cytochrome b/b6 domain-containing protein [Armatimonadetes bacterium]|nr:cytochrome b/b6 domain-containing protein [Armatimonadota bacterium]